MRIESRKVGLDVSGGFCAAAVVVIALSMGGARLAAAGPSASITDEQQGDFDGLSQQVEDTGGAPQLWLDEVTGAPRVLALRAPVTAGGVRRAEDRSPVRARVARQFLSEHRRLFKVTDPDAEFSLVKAEVDEVSLSHLRFQQWYRGVPLWSRQVIVHLDAQGNVYLVQGRTVPTPEGLDVVPKITSDAAVRASRGHLGVGDAPAQQTPSAELVVFEPDDGTPRLAYKVRISSWTYFIDAGTGAVLGRLTNIRHEVMEAQGTDLWDVTQTFQIWREGDQYILLDPTMPLEDDPTYDPMSILDTSQLRGDLLVIDAEHGEERRGVSMTSTSPTGPWDATGVSAMVNLAKVNDYYDTVLGCKGPDGEGESIVAVVHYGKDYNNAVWDGDWLLFGDGDGKSLSKLAGCLDIVAHEYTHAVTQYATDLVYANQSGALSESYSDFFAAMIDGNWTSGEGCVLEPPGFARDLADPHRSASWQPAKMGEYRKLPNTEEGDWGGVHLNAGIPNRAGYLLAEGLTAEGRGASVGRDLAARIVYKALTDYLTPGATFLDARNAWGQAASDLYGPNSPAVAANRAAWDAVEVQDIAPLGRMWGGQGIVSGGGTSCFVSVCTLSGCDPAFRVFLLFAIFAAVAVLGTARGAGPRS
jgi:Zn-dependent metalloprotease